MPRVTKVRVEEQADGSWMLRHPYANVPGHPDEACGQLYPSREHAELVAVSARALYES
jgi:hypothetical protein